MNCNHPDTELCFPGPRSDDFWTQWQSSELSYAVPKVWPHLGKLQATSPLFVVQGQPPAQGLPGEEKCCNCQLAKRDKAHPANIRIADT
jgi:hypothetical protein